MEFKFELTFQVCGSDQLYPVQRIRDNSHCESSGTLYDKFNSIILVLSNIFYYPIIFMSFR